MPHLFTDSERIHDAQLETELQLLQGLRPELIEDVADMDARVAAIAEEMAKIAARRASKMEALSRMDAHIEAVNAERASLNATSRASAKDVSPGRQPTNLAADSPASEVDKQYKLLKAQEATRSAKEAARSANVVVRAANLAADTPSPEDEATRRYKRCKAELVARRAERALAPASPASAKEANDVAFDRYLAYSPESEQDLAAGSPETEVDKQYKLLKAQKAARSAKEAARSAKQAASYQAYQACLANTTPEHEIRNRRRSARLALVPASPVSAAARLGEDTAFPTHT